MRLLPFALLALAAAASSGCRRSMAPICRALCTCSPCTQLDFDACVTKGETAEQSAEKSGCADTFDTMVSCLEDNLSCRKDGSGPGTDQCNRAVRAMILCDGSVSPFATVCEEAPLKSEACTNTIPMTPVKPPASCAGLNECAAKCTLAQPCDVLDGNTSNKPLVDCLNKCQMKGGSGGGPQGGPP